MSELPRIASAEVIIHGVLKIIFKDGYEGVVDLRVRAEPFDVMTEVRLPVREKHGLITRAAYRGQREVPPLDEQEHADEDDKRKHHLAGEGVLVTHPVVRLSRRTGPRRRWGRRCGGWYLPGLDQANGLGDLRIVAQVLDLK